MLCYLGFVRSDTRVDNVTPTLLKTPNGMNGTKKKIPHLVNNISKKKKRLGCAVLCAVLVGVGLGCNDERSIVTGWVGMERGGMGGMERGISIV